MSASKCSAWPSQQTYGDDKLADRIRQIAPAVLPGLTVPVDVTVVVDAQGGEHHAADPIRDPAPRFLADTADGYPATPVDL